MTTDQRSFLEAYNPDKYPRPSITVDLVIFTVVDSDLKVLLVKRSARREAGFLCKFSVGCSFDVFSLTALVGDPNEAARQGPDPLERVRRTFDEQHL